MKREVAAKRRVISVEYVRKTGENTRMQAILHIIPRQFRARSAENGSRVSFGGVRKRTARCE